MWRNQRICTLLVGMQNDVAIGENSLEVPQKVKHGITMWPGIPLLGMFSREMKIYVQTETCIQMFIAALFITAKWWKNPNAYQEMTG